MWLTVFSCFMTKQLIPSTFLVQYWNGYCQVMINWKQKFHTDKTWHMLILSCSAMPKSLLTQHFLFFCCYFSQLIINNFTIEHIDITFFVPYLELCWCIGKWIGLNSQITTRKLINKNANTNRFFLCILRWYLPTEFFYC